MCPQKVNCRPTSRTASMPRSKVTSASFSAKRSAPSISPARNTSAETSPIRSYVSTIKDFTNYTPLRLAREKVSQSHSKIAYRSSFNASVSASSDDIPRLRATHASALDSLNDLRSKTEKLDAESRKFAEKVTQMKQKMQKDTRQQPQLATRKGKKDARNFARSCVKAVSRACYPVLRSVVDLVHEKAEKTASLERQAVRFYAKLRLKTHFCGWKSAFQVREIETNKLTEVAIKHYHLQLAISTMERWKEATKWGKLRPEDRKRRVDISTVLSASAKPNSEPVRQRPSSVSPKPAQAHFRPFSSKPIGKLATRSPTLSPKPSTMPRQSPKRSAVTPKLHKKAISSPAVKPEPILDVPSELYQLAVAHYRSSSLFYRAWKPWKSLVQSKSELARRHYRKRVGTCVFHSWLEFYVESCEAREQNPAESQSEDETDDSSAQYDDILAAFRLQTVGPRLIAAWKEFVGASRSEREQEHRRNLMWKKVNSWLDQYKSTETQSS